MCCLLLVDQQNSWVSSQSSLHKRLVERQELNWMMVLTFECSAAFSTGVCFWYFFFFMENGLNCNFCSWEQKADAHRESRCCCNF